MNWCRHIRGNLRRNEPLAAHTSFRIGGPARFFCEPRDAAALKELLKALKGDTIPPLILGAGSNLLVSDAGVRAAVIRLSAPAFREIKISASSVLVGAGYAFNRLIAVLAAAGRCGFEACAGIPGTVGGALIMNAGSRGDSIGAHVQRITVMDRSGRVRTLSPRQARFGYRTSALAAFVVLETVLAIRSCRPRQAQARIGEYIALRRQTQDLRYPSAGSVFKNPPGASAGALIDACGLKGVRIGAAAISRKHANWIVNLGSAKATDVRLLMRRMQRSVAERYGICLEPEIVFWGKGAL